VFRLHQLKLSDLDRLELPTGISANAMGAALALPVEYRRVLATVEEIPFRAVELILRDPRHLSGLTPRQFEEFVAGVVDRLGFQDVRLTPRSADGGKDVIASRRVNGIPISFYFECKKYAEGNKVQLDTLRGLLGTVAHDSRKANIGVLVTTSTFTRGCHELLASECRLDGKDYQGLLGWVSEISAMRKA
jgi:restriction endonuclease Mrr